jgi:hypothetical protein
LEFILKNVTAPPGTVAFLEDSFLQSRTAINMQDTTRANFSVTGNPGSYAVDRFKVVFNPLIVFTDIHASQINNDVSISWDVAKEYNIDGYELERSTDGLHFEKISSLLSTGNSSLPVQYQYLDINTPSGFIYYYRVKCYNSAGVEMYSNVVSLKILKNSPDIYIYPNPVCNNTISLQMNGTKTGLYYVRLLNKLGQLMWRGFINHSLQTSTETISPGIFLSESMYELELTAPDQVVTSCPVIIK